MPLYDYQCPTCGSFDALGSIDDDTAICLCGQTAVRKAFYKVYARDGDTSSKLTRQRYRDFDEASHEVDHVYSKHEDNGDPVKRPSLYKEGMAVAKKRGAKIRRQ